MARIVSAKNITLAVLGLATCLALSACQTTGKTPGKTTSDKIATAVDRAKAAAGQEPKPLSVAERAYKKAPQDELTATDYARALREEGMLDKAAMILQPFAEGKKPLSYTLSEYAAIHLAQGDSKKAEEWAQKAILKDETNFRAFHNLGLALETQAKHEEAERAFRKGLDLWQGNPTTIMNNLALNLAAQGYMDESVEILRKAQTISPDRKEIERNLRIVTALQQAARGPTPMPPKKPKS
jgi:Flp pilus assembly protein TadD